MEDRITVFDKKPFKGITTIQLFDKKTGELVKEIVHENTYNQRLQYSMYLDEIMSVRSNDNIPTSWSLYSQWGNAIRNLGVIRRSYSNTMWSVTPFGTTNYQNTFNLFGTLFLTNHTSAASASGHADGIPIAIAPLSGIASDAAAQISCGTLNVQESYIHDDRVHFVIDFDTSHGNGTFDSLWIFPSTQYVYSNTGGLPVLNQCDSMTPFYDFAEIKQERMETSVSYSGQSCRFLHINKPYLVIADYQLDPNNYATIYKYHVYNTQTDQVVASYDFGSGRNLPYTPLYYDAIENILYGVYFYQWNTIWNDNRFWIQDATGSKAMMRPVTINLTTGVVTEHSSTDLVANANITFEDLDIHTVGNAHTTLFYAENGNYYFITSHKGLDEDNVLRTVISIILYNPKTFAITPSRHIMCNGATYDLSTAVVQHNLLYLPNFTTDLATTNLTQTGLVINLATGSILESKWCNYQNARNNTFQKAIGSLHISVDGPKAIRNGSYLQSDIMLWLPYSVWPSQDSANKVVYFTRSTWIRALWTTHNHLEEAVTKTNQTTMKIQYDIVWDSITETIIPALL